MCVCEHLGEGERMVVYWIIFLAPLLHAHISMSALPPYPPWGYKSTGNYVTHQTSRKVFKGVASRASLD